MNRLITNFTTMLSLPENLNFSIDHQVYLETSWYEDTLEIHSYIRRGVIDEPQSDRDILLHFKQLLEKIDLLERDASYEYFRIIDFTAYGTKEFHQKYRIFMGNTGPGSIWTGVVCDLSTGEVIALIISPEEGITNIQLTNEGKGLLYQPKTDIALYDEMRFFQSDLFKPSRLQFSTNIFDEEDWLKYVYDFDTGKPLFDLLNSGTCLSQGEEDSGRECKCQHDPFLQCKLHKRDAVRGILVERYGYVEELDFEWFANENSLRKFTFSDDVPFTRVIAFVILYGESIYSTEYWGFSSKICARKDLVLPEPLVFRTLKASPTWSNLPSELCKHIASFLIDQPVVYSDETEAFIDIFEENEVSIDGIRLILRYP